MKGVRRLRLFKAWSIIDKFLEQEQVRMDWFVVGRAEPPAPWEEMIIDYDEEDDNAIYDRIMVTELLNESEVKQLAVYLDHKHQLELYTEEVELPIKSGGLSHGLLLISGAKGFYPLVEEEGYPLEVSVLGHYECKETETVKSLSPKDLNAGITFLQCLADYWPYDSTDESKGQELLQKIYADTGLRVIQD